jgi:hypothetical protein
MPKKGCTRTPDPTFEDVLAVIARMKDHEVFSIEQVRSRTPHRTYRQVLAVLRYKTKQGALDRVGPGQYRWGGVRIKTTSPKGLVAEAVWAVLFTAPKPMRLGEIVGEAESYIGRPGVSIYGPTACVLYSWHKDGHLERTGQQGEYAYHLKPGVTERPVLRH